MTDGVAVGAEGRKIMADIAARRGIEINAHTMASRFGPHVEMRQEMAFALWSTGRYSLPSIGREMGKDHSTILHSVRREAKRRDVELPRGRIREGREVTIWVAHDSPLRRLLDTAPGEASRVLNEAAERLENLNEATRKAPLMIEAWQNDDGTETYLLNGKRLPL